jgi:hypothetical protein
MPIVALILSTLAIWTICWFSRMGGIDHILARRVQRRDADRLNRARASERSAPLRAIDDSRARENGDPTREQVAAIEKLVCATFGFGHELAARMTQARSVARRADSFAQAAAVFADLFNKKLTVDEKCELVAMVEQVANLDGRSQAHEEALDVLVRRVGLAPAR